MDTVNQVGFDKLKTLSQETGMDLSGATVRRSSSRFCLGVEHGDYNGTELFGVGTDRFIWFAYKPTQDKTVKLYSANFPNDGVIEFEIGNVPKPQSKETADTWARFPYGVDYVLQKNGYKLTNGIEGILFGNIPGGGMSRSASLSLNLILSILDANSITIEDPFKVVDLAQEVENDYIGSPCGQLDQIMILFAKEGMGTHYDPKNKTINYVPLGPGGEDLRIFIMDTGTVRPGLEKSTYKIRRSECEQLVKLAQDAGISISCLADVKESSLYEKIRNTFKETHPDLCDRLTYIYQSQKRFYEMMDAWKSGDINKVGAIFREDGLGLRDEYKISGPELETMCDIARTVEGVLGERMLGGGDKGAAGALVLNNSVEMLKKTVDTAYPRSRTDFADRFACHVCSIVDGIVTYNDIF